MEYEDLIGEIDSDGNAISEGKFSEDKTWAEFFDDLSAQRKVEMVNSPMHYTSGRVEVIDVIEDAVRSSEDPIAAVLQGQVLKYMLRMWLKGKPEEDAQKAQWYLNRLIDHMASNA